MHPADIRMKSFRCRAVAVVLASCALLAAGCGRSPAPLVDVLPLPDTRDTEGPYELAVTITSVATVTRAEVRWFVNGGAAAPLALVREGTTDRYIARLPGQPPGAVVRYQVWVEDDEGNRVVRPAEDDTRHDGAFQFTVLLLD